MVNEHISPTKPKSGGVLHAVDRVIALTTRIFLALACACVAIFMIQIGLDVFLRNLMGVSFPGTLGYTQYWWLPALVFLALGMTEMRQGHIKVTLATDGASVMMRKIAATVSTLITLVVLGLMLNYGIVEASHSLSISEASVSDVTVLIWPIRIILVLGIGLYMIQVLRSWFLDLRPDRATAKSEDL